MTLPLGVLASAHVTPAGGGSVSAEFVTASNTTSGSTVRTYSGIAIGDAAANRNVIIVCHSRSQNINSATIAGNEATLHATFTDGVMRTAVFSAVVTSGTTADIVVTHAGNPGAVTVGVYAAYGTLTYNTNATEGNGRTVSLTAPSDALIVVGLSSTFYTAGDWSMGAQQTYEVPSGTNLGAWGGMDEPPAGAWSLTLTSVPGLTNYANHSYVAVAFTLT